MNKILNFAIEENVQEQNYWKEMMSSDMARSNFSFDHNISPISYDFKTCQFIVDDAVYQKLMKICNQSNSKLLMILTAVLNILIDRYTGNKDITIGMPIEKQELEGNFINKILPIRNEIIDDISFKEFLLKVRENIIKATENQNYPIDAIIYDLGLASNGESCPLFDIALLLENIHDKEYLSELKINTIFSFINEDNKLISKIEYNAVLFDEITVRRISKHFENILKEVLVSPEMPLSEVKMLNNDEFDEFIVTFNTTNNKYSFQTFQQLFEQQVKVTPDNIAVCYDQFTITYSELNQRANILANILRTKGVKQNTIVCLMGMRNIEMIIAILGVMKSGGAYLPINAKDPTDRIHYILEDSKTHLLLTQKHVVENNIELLKLGDKIICIDNLLLEKIDQQTAKNISETTDIYKQENLAYVIYTSGTTGKPKGVMIDHNALVNYLSWAAKTYVNEGKVDFPFYTSFSFDMTITSIFVPLITGNSILIYSGDEKEFILEKVIKDNKAGIIKATPSHLKMIRENLSIFDKYVQNGTEFKVKKIIVGGEDFNSQLAKDLYVALKGKIEIYNEYGPTESTVGCMIYRFDPDMDKRQSVPIGKPIDNVQIYLLDRNLKPVPYGASGELYISGNSLARGYLYKPELTATRFLNNPFVAGQKIYKTGDLARRLNNGNIEFLGRNDQQVKIRGFRVELGEIENKIVEYQKKHGVKYSVDQQMFKSWDLHSIVRCKKCLIPQGFPGVGFDQNGVCDICNEYEGYKDKAAKYFKKPQDILKVVEAAKNNKKSDYDCLLLYSGGKDSSYVLHKLVELGLKVLAFTYDNGYVSEAAFENIKRTTSLLNVDLLVVKSEYMNEVFVESLRTEHNVCNGCFKGVNTVGTKIANDYNINLVVSGLSRGQIFDIKLQGLFKLDIFDEDTINERLKLFRKEYHSMKNKTSRLLNIELTDKMIDDIYFIDYYEYDNISVSKIYEYLKQKDAVWSRPNDTGLSSSNCMINDVGIYVHLKDKGHHFYEAQLSWDCRLGSITREEGLEEVSDFKVHPDTLKILTDIGYYKAPIGAVVIDKKDRKGDQYLCAYIVGDKDFKTEDLKTYLMRDLPDYMIPSRYVKIDMVPLNTNGKVDIRALPDPELNAEVEYVAPRNATEQKLVDIWSDLLDLPSDKVGIDVNFFEIGGHSLKATMLITKMQKEFNLKIPLTEIFKYPTVRKLALSIDIVANSDQESLKDEANKIII